MRKLVVLTDPESADGFRLAGVDVVEVKEGDRVAIKKKLVSLINDDDIGIIAINEDFTKSVDEGTRVRIDKLYRPIVVSIPSKKKLGSEDLRSAYLAEVIRKAVGFDIKV